MYDSGRACENKLIEVGWGSAPKDGTEVNFTQGTHALDAIKQNEHSGSREGIREEVRDSCNSNNPSREDLDTSCQQRDRSCVDAEESKSGVRGVRQRGRYRSVPCVMIDVRTARHESTSMQFPSPIRQGLAESRTLRKRCG